MPAIVSANCARSAPSRKSASLNQGNSPWRIWLSACTAHRWPLWRSNISHGGRGTRTPKVNGGHGGLPVRGTILWPEGSIAGAQPRTREGGKRPGANGGEGAHIEGCGIAAGSRVRRQRVLSTTCISCNASTAGRNRKARFCSSIGVVRRKCTRNCLNRSPRPTPKNRASGTRKKIVRRIGANSSTAEGSVGKFTVWACVMVEGTGSVVGCAGGSTLASAARKSAHSRTRPANCSGDRDT